ncbi:MAG: hypothetical protein ACQGVK_21370 [Myxococcota bacterium]
MLAGTSALVDLVRDFLSVYLRLRTLFDRSRAGELRFEDVPALVGDDRDSLLFRLKERSHALYRAEGGEGGVPRPRQALFDLAVGSLFHEAMKLRENLYQTEIYAPKVRELQKAAGAESDVLFREFEKILNVAGARLSEALDEAEELLEHTRSQFRSLLSGYRDEPLIARTLVAESHRVSETFPDGIDAILADIWGSAAEGYVTAAVSYLESAYFEEAILALAEAEKRSDGREDLARLAAYAEGMQAYQAGDYEASLERFDTWLDLGPLATEGAFARLALSAITSVESLVPSEERAGFAQSSAEVAKRIRSFGFADDLPAS